MAIQLPTLDGKIPREAHTAIKDLAGHIDTLHTKVADVKTMVEKIPDPHGPLTSDQVSQIQHALLAGNNLVQQVKGFTVLPNIPATDPKVKGALWNNAGVLAVSAG